MSVCFRTKIRHAQSVGMSFLGTRLDSFELSGCCMDVPYAHIEDWWDRMLACSVSLCPSRGCRRLGTGVGWFSGRARGWVCLGSLGPSPFCFASLVVACPSFSVSSAFFLPPGSLVPFVFSFVSSSLFLPMFLMVVFRVVVVCLFAFPHSWHFLPEYHGVFERRLGPDAFCCSESLGGCSKPLPAKACEFCMCVCFTPSPMEVADNTSRICFVIILQNVSTGLIRSVGYISWILVGAMGVIISKPQLDPLTVAAHTSAHCPAW